MSRNPYQEPFYGLRGPPSNLTGPSNTSTSPSYTPTTSSYAPAGLTYIRTRPIYTGYLQSTLKPICPYDPDGCSKACANEYHPPYPQRYQEDPLLRAYLWNILHGPDSIHNQYCTRYRSQPPVPTQLRIVPTSPVYSAQQEYEAEQAEQTRQVQEQQVGQQAQAELSAQTDVQGQLQQQFQGLSLHPNIVDVLFETQQPQQTQSQQEPAHKNQPTAPTETTYGQSRYGYRVPLSYYDQPGSEGSAMSTGYIRPIELRCHKLRCPVRAREVEQHLTRLADELNGQSQEPTFDQEQQKLRQLMVDESISLYEIEDVLDTNRSRGQRGRQLEPDAPRSGHDAYAGYGGYNRPCAYESAHFAPTLPPTASELNPPTLGTDRLPSGWEQRHTPAGRAYLVDHNTRMTTWIDLCGQRQQYGANNIQKQPGSADSYNRYINHDRYHDVTAEELNPQSTTMPNQEAQTTDRPHDHENSIDPGDIRHPTAEPLRAFIYNADPCSRQVHCEDFQHNPNVLHRHSNDQNYNMGVPLLTAQGWHPPQLHPHLSGYYTPRGAYVPVPYLLIDTKPTVDELRSYSYCIRPDSMQDLAYDEYQLDTDPRSHYRYLDGQYYTVAELGVSRV